MLSGRGVCVPVRAAACAGNIELFIDLYIALAALDFWYWCSAQTASVAIAISSHSALSLTSRLYLHFIRALRFFTETARRDMNAKSHNFPCQMERLRSAARDYLISTSSYVVYLAKGLFCYDTLLAAMISRKMVLDAALKILRKALTFL